MQIFGNIHPFAERKELGFLLAPGSDRHGVRESTNAFEAHQRAHEALSLTQGYIYSWTRLSPVRITHQILEKS